MRGRTWMLKRRMAVLLAASLLLFPGEAGRMEAAGKPALTLSMAKKLGLGSSAEYEKLESQLELKEVSLKQALKSIREKQKNMSTFRWSPLLSFKFPEKPDLAEAYEFQFKPIQIQAEIDTVKHKMTDQVLAVYEEISNLYVEVVVLEETIAFNEERLSVMEETLKKNQQKLKLGQATKADIDKMEKSLHSISSKVAADRRSLEADKKKLSKAIGMDVSTGYSFQAPFVDAELQRSQLGSLTQYTLDRDQTYYEASLTAATNLISLRTNYSLMEGQYGSKMGYISNYVNQAIAGRKIDNRAFKKQYEKFLKAIDEPWQGSRRILFFRFPKEWFKGQLSGIRYVEDEPYALHEAVLEYQDSLLEKEQTREGLISQVEDSFNSLVSLRNAYASLEEQVEEAGRQLEADEALNRLGELTYDEYKSSLDEYEDMQNEMFEALAMYSQSLYSFDRLTCGGITALLEGEDAYLSAGGSGESHVEEEYANGAYYYIEPIIQEQEFRMGVSIPEDFDVEVSDFELWCDNVQIGSRTSVGQTLRHLKLAVDGVTEVKIRFYKDGEFVDDCAIDPENYSGPLSITKGYTLAKEENREIGTYESQTDIVTGMVEIRLEPYASENIQSYLIKDAQGNCLVTKTPIAIQTEFRYLSLLQGSLEDLIIEFYGEDASLKYTGCFDTKNKKLKQNLEGA